MQQKAAINATVQIVKNGPYKVSGNLPMTKQTIGTNAAGESIKWVAGSAIPTPA